MYAADVDNKLALYIKGHGLYMATTDGMDHATAFFANATDNDIMWNLVEHAGYELDYSDIGSRVALLIAWCDTHGLTSDEPDKEWHEYIKRQYSVDEKRTPEWWEAGTRRIQGWMAEVRMNHDFSDLNSVKQDENGRLYIECDGWHLVDGAYEERSIRTIQIQPEWVHPDGTKSTREGMWVAFCSDFQNKGGCGHMYEIPADRIRQEEANIYARPCPHYDDSGNRISCSQAEADFMNQDRG